MSATTKLEKEESVYHKESEEQLSLLQTIAMEIAAAGGQLAEAEAELGAAFDQLRTHPVPILAWKLYAALGRLRLQLDGDQSARAAFAQAAAIIDAIAASVNDQSLRSGFLNSEAVREVLEGAGR